MLEEFDEEVQNDKKGQMIAAKDLFVGFAYDENKRFSNLMPAITKKTSYS